jgi:hypothetical protein
VASNASRAWALEQRRTASSASKRLIGMDHLVVEANNLSNSRRRYERNPAFVNAIGQPMGDGFFELHGKFNPLAELPTFQLESTISRFDLTKINPFFYYYGGVKVDKGIMNLYLEFAAEKGQFRGYVKPFVDDLHFASVNDPSLKFIEKVKGVIANILAGLLRNRTKDSNATKVEFSGSFDKPTVHTWEAIKFAFRHAFIEALAPKLDHSIIPQKALTQKKIPVAK